MTRRFKSKRVLKTCYGIGRDSVIATVVPCATNGWLYPKSADRRKVTFKADSPDVTTAMARREATTRRNIACVERRASDASPLAKFTRSVVLRLK